MILPKGGLIRVFSPFAPHPVTEGAFRVIADQLKVLGQLGYEVQVEHWKDRDRPESFAQKARRAAAFLVAGEASPELYYYPPSGIRTRHGAAQAAALEIYHYSFAYAWLRRMPAAPEGTKRVVHFHNLESELSLLRGCSGNAAFSRLHGLNAKRLRRHEAAIADLSDEQWFVSRSDLRQYSETVSAARARLVPPGFDRSLGESRRRDFVQGGVRDADFFLGMIGRYDFEPNRMSLAWVIERLGPELRARGFSGKIQVLGKYVPDGLRAKAQAFGFFEFPGFVADLEPYWRSWSFSLVPHVSGSGVRIKLLESLASGVPVIANAAALEPVAEKLRSLAEMHELDRPEDWARFICAEKPLARRAALTRLPFPEQLDLSRVYDFLS